MNAEIKRLLKDGHIEKVNKIKVGVFIQPTVITVKRDRLVKIGCDARADNQALDNDKYQMPNLENMVNMVAEKPWEKCRLRIKQTFMLSAKAGFHYEGQRTGSP